MRDTYGPTVVVLVAYREPLVVTGNGGSGRSIELNTPAMNEHCARAEEVDCVHRMADEDDCRPFSLKDSHAVKTAKLEGDITDGEDLIDEQDVRLDMDCHREPQSHVHTGRIELHRCVDELFQLGKSDDVVEAGFNLGLLQSEEHPIDEDVLSPRHFLMKSDANAQQGRDAAAHSYRACRRLAHSGQEAQERALSGAVPSDQADRLALVDREIDS